MKVVDIKKGTRYRFTTESGEVLTSKAMAEKLGTVTTYINNMMLKIKGKEDRIAYINNRLFKAET